ncbi:MAG: hypothetical protein BWY68_00406 [bacterium ADurb.Bin400]|nr:MAG: hypothetical protein BWY68_00406 [bacterium ADurb.Bin400]
MRKLLCPWCIVKVGLPEGLAAMRETVRSYLSDFGHPGDRAYGVCLLLTEFLANCEKHKTGDDQALVVLYDQGDKGLRVTVSLASLHNPVARKRCQDGIDATATYRPDDHLKEEGGRGLHLARIYTEWIDVSIEDGRAVFIIPANERVAAVNDICQEECGGYDLRGQRNGPMALSA